MDQGMKNEKECLKMVLIAEHRYCSLNSVSTFEFSWSIIILMKIPRTGE